MAKRRAANTQHRSDPGTPNSLGSAQMDESDSDDEAPPSKSRAADDDENKYPVEGLFRSEKEKIEIMSMREVEREQIIAERAQEQDRAEGREGRPHAFRSTRSGAGAGPYSGARIRRPGSGARRRG